jgi:hypothetical protein
MAMGISIKTAEPAEPIAGDVGGRANNSEQGKHVRIQVVQNAKIQNRDNRSFVSCMSTSFGMGYGPAAE